MDGTGNHREYFLRSRWGKDVQVWKAGVLSACSLLLCACALWLCACALPSRLFRRRRFCPGALLAVGEGPFPSHPVPAECEDAEAGDPIHLAFSPRGFPAIHGALVTRAPLQFRTPGGPSEPPFSQGLCQLPFGHVRGRGRPEQQQQPPWPCAHCPAGSPRSRQGEGVGVGIAVGG